MKDKYLKNKREDWIDRTKGIAIILVILGHAISGADSLRTDNVGIWEWLYRGLSSFHMPVFFVISGYLSHIDNSFLKTKEYIKYIRKKFFSLIIPYLEFEVIYCLIGILTDDKKYTLKALSQCLYAPVSHFWFIYVLFFIYVIVPVIWALVKRVQYLIIFFTGISICFFIMGSNLDWIFPIDKICYYAIFFSIGIFISNNKTFFQKLNKIKYILSCGIVWIVLIIVGNKFNDKFIGYKLLSGVTGCLWFMATTYALPHNKIITFWGRETMPMYLIHSLFLSIIRRLMLNLGITNIDIIVIVSFAGATAGVSLVAFVARKITFLKAVFYPNKMFIKNQK